MDSAALRLIIAIIIAAGYLFELGLDLLNASRWSNTIPSALQGLYNEETYRKQQDYRKANLKMSLVTDFLSFAAILAMLLCGGFAWLDAQAGALTVSPLWQALLFFGAIALASDLVAIPFDIYNTFVIEERFGFNTTTPRTFVADRLKSWLIMAIVGGGLLALIVVVFQYTGAWFWVLAWTIITVFTLLAGYFYTALLVPLFNKLSPLPDGELRQVIEQTALKAQFGIRNIFVMNASKRSTKGNAYFSGFGRRKSIVLFDTLISGHTPDELGAILAHEIGHYKKKHVLKGLLISVLQTGILLFILQLMLQSDAPALALGAGQPSFHMGLTAFAMLYSPVSLLLRIGMNYLSRSNEFEADRFAVSLSKPGVLARALKNLSVKNLSNLTPHPWYVFVHYSHPPLLERLAAIEAANTQYTASGSSADGATQI